MVSGCLDACVCYHEGHSHGYLEGFDSRSRTACFPKNWGHCDTLQAYTPKSSYFTPMAPTVPDSNVTYTAKPVATKPGLAYCQITCPE
jgi:hypothetical protein